MKKGIIHLLFVTFFGLFVLSSNTKECANNLSVLPFPQKISCDLSASVHIIEEPCAIVYRVQIQNGENKQEIIKHFRELIGHQQLKAFGCHMANIAIQVQNEKRTVFVSKNQRKGYQVNVHIKDPSLKSVFTRQQQSYSLQVTQKLSIISTNTYVGFVRALETFIQIVDCGQNKIKHTTKSNKNNSKNLKNCSLHFLPIIITNDTPINSYQPVMIDTSRHYLPLNLIFQTIDALMYNKMNVLHWHIVDEDSFPLLLDSHPEIAESGAFSQQQIYKKDQVKQIVKYALVRGVRVVPELDTPGHAASWGRSEKNKGKSCLIGAKTYMGPLDVTLKETYELMKEVFAQILQIFSDPFVHLGGDEVQLSCVLNLQQFLKQNNIKQQQLQHFYRKKQRQILIELNPNKKFIYWVNDISSILHPDDIVQWWGGLQIPLCPIKQQFQVTVQFYIDMGVGNYFGDNYGQYVTRKNLYQLTIWDQMKQKQNVIGAQVTLWSELSNQFTHHVKIWIRTSSLAERTWTNIKNSDFVGTTDFLRRLTKHERLMNRRGYRLHLQLRNNVKCTRKSLYKMERARQSSSMTYANRRYIKKGTSPDAGPYVSPAVKSNQDIFSQTPYLQPNHRPHQKSGNIGSTSKIGTSRQDILMNYQLLGISQSKNIITDNRKRGRSSYYKKVADLNNSEMFFEESKVGNTKDIRKVTSQEMSIENIENQVEQMHYKMVQFQQKCKKMVAN